jgi:two-component system chemotaxis response regulator CheB
LDTVFCRQEGWKGILMNAPLKVMVVDDAITYRMILKEVIRGIPDAEVVATAVNGRDALEKLKETPTDLVLLDVEMPQMNGIETMQAIRSLYPGLGVVMISGANLGSANMTIRALEAGALDFIPKPEGANAQENLEELRRRLKPIVNITMSKQVRGGSAPEKSASLPSAPPPATTAPTAGKIPPKLSLPPMHIDVVVIGISTGGPKALSELIPSLPEVLGAPVLVVQHMPPVFTASLADNLDKKSRIKVKEAADGETILPNHVYLAPGGHHMIVHRERAGAPPKIGLHDGPPENSCRPAVDVLFRSVAEVYGKNILSVIMTGMGSDGAKGVQVIKQTPGNYCLTQSADTCVIYGMPRATDDLGLSDEKIPLPNLASRIVSLVKGGLSHATST